MNNTKKSRTWLIIGILSILTIMFAGLAQSAHAELYDGLIAYYSLDEASGSALDSTGNYDLPQYGGTSQYSFTGKIGTSRYANAANGFFYTESFEGLHYNDNFSYSAWIRRNGTETLDGITLWHGNGLNAHLTLRLQNGVSCANTNQVRLLVYAPRPSYVYPTMNCSAVLDPYWTHVVVIHHASNAGNISQMYINGTLVSQSYNTYKTSIVYTESQTFSLGSAYVDATFIDEVAVYNRTLSAAEVLSLYNGGAGVSYATLSTPTIKLNISAYSLLNNSFISTFNATVNSIYNSSYPFTISNQTSTGNMTFYLSDVIYNVTVVADGFSDRTVLVSGLNLTGINNVSVGLQLANSINFSFYNIMNGTLIKTTQVGAQLIGDDASYTITTTNGSYYLSNILQGNYTIRYNATGFPIQYAYVELNDRTAQDLSIYMMPTASSSQITMTVYDDAIVPAKDLFVKVMRYNSTLNTYVLVETIKTNNLGQIQFYANVGTEFYQFMFEKPFGTVLETSEPSLIASTTTTYILSNNDFSSDFFDVQDVTSYIDYNNATSNFRVTFSDPNMKLEDVCLNIYSNTSYSLLASNCTGAGVYSGTLLVNYPYQNGTKYQAIAIGTISSIEYVLAREDFEFNTSPNSTTSALLIVAAVMVVLAFAMREQGVAVMLIVTPIPLVLASTFGFILIPAWVAIAIEMLAIVLAYMAGRRS